MLAPFENKNFIIVGATGGIGQALAQLLVENAAKIFLVARNTARVERLGTELKMPYRACDVADFAEFEHVCLEAANHFERIDGIVNCAGSFLIKSISDTSLEEFTGVLNSNLYTAFSVVRAAHKVLLPHGGSIVLMSSAAASIGLSNHEAIAAAKAAIIGLTLSAAASYAKDNIRVNAIAPGLIETPLTAFLTSNSVMKQASEAMHPLHRLGNPKQVARLIAFLLDSNNDWITGQTIGIDGGLANLKVKLKL